MVCCVANCLELNVVKTKELVIDFRSDVHHPTPININGQHIDIVHSYKYLGTYIDRNILFVFHDSFVKSVMTFGLVCWWGNLSVKKRERLNYTQLLAKSLCAVHPIPVWNNCTSQEHCK